MIYLDCYSLIKNDCDGRCQGCSYCPFVSANVDNTPIKITRRMMVKFAIGDMITGLKRKWFFWRHKVEIGKILDEYLKEKENKVEE